jgi:hypothetical protein
LLANLGGGFKILGTHDTISRCALPPDTPEDVLDTVISHFSHQLREDMGLLMQLNITPVITLPHAAQLLTRISSTESQPTSLHSSADGEEYHINAFVGLWDIVLGSLPRFLHPGS